MTPLLRKYRVVCTMKQRQLVLEYDGIEFCRNDRKLGIYLRSLFLTVLVVRELKHN